MRRTRRVLNKKRTRRKRQRAGVPSSKTFKMPDLITGERRALARRSAILKKQASNPVVSKKRPKSFTAQDVIQVKSKMRKRKMEKNAAKIKEWSDAFRTMSEADLMLFAAREKAKLSSAMRRAKIRPTKSST